MNDFQEKVALVARRTSGIVRSVSVSLAPIVEDPAVERSPSHQEYEQGNSRELLRQGALIAGFFRGRW
jgi:hypothetical protein